jgi:hypothetical protein
VRESSHYVGGEYVRVYDGDANLTLECLSGEFLARADADSAAQVLAAATLISEALTRLDLCHRFEVYSEAADDMVAYLHHRWPTDTMTEPSASE